MFGWPGIIVSFAVAGQPVDPQPRNVDGFGSLCESPWMSADAVASFRGVRVEDNGTGHCCLLSDQRSFVCEMGPGHQHEEVVRTYLRFYDGSSVRPRVDLVVRARPNPGMRPNPTPPAPFASLRLSLTDDGFELLPRVKASCDPARGPAKEVCANAGRWVFVGGVPRRRP